MSNYRYSLAGAAPQPTTSFMNPSSTTTSGGIPPALHYPRQCACTSSKIWLDIVVVMEVSSSMTAPGLNQARFFAVYRIFKNSGTLWHCHKYSRYATSTCHYSANNRKHVFLARKHIVTCINTTRQKRYSCCKCKKCWRSYYALVVNIKTLLFC